MKEFLHLCCENRISWFLGYFLKMRTSENRTTEIHRNQGPGVLILFGLKVEGKYHLRLPNIDSWSKWFWTELGKWKCGQWRLLCLNQPDNWTGLNCFWKWYPKNWEKYDLWYLVSWNHLIFPRYSEKLSKLFFSDSTFNFHMKIKVKNKKTIKKTHFQITLNFPTRTPIPRILMPSAKFWIKYNYRAKAF